MQAVEGAPPMWNFKSVDGQTDWTCEDVFFWSFFTVVTSRKTNMSTAMNFYTDDLAKVNKHCQELFAVICQGKRIGRSTCRDAWHGRAVRDGSNQREWDACYLADLPTERQGTPTGESLPQKEPPREGTGRSEDSPQAASSQGRTSTSEDGGTPTGESLPHDPLREGNRGSKDSLQKALSKEGTPTSELPQDASPQEDQIHCGSETVGAHFKDPSGWRFVSTDEKTVWICDTELIMLVELQGLERSYVHASQVAQSTFTSKDGKKCKSITTVMCKGKHSPRSSCDGQKWITAAISGCSFRYRRRRSRGRSKHSGALA